MNEDIVNKALSSLGAARGCGALMAHAKELGVTIPPDLADPSPPPSDGILHALREIPHRLWPRLDLSRAHEQSADALPSV